MNSNEKLNYIKKQIADGKKTFVMYVGIPGSGKSTNAFENFNNTVIIDQDEIAKEITEEFDWQTKLSFAHRMKQKRFKKQLHEAVSFVDAGVNANRIGSLNKITNAKAYGFSTVVVFVNTPVHVAIDRNASRLLGGSHGIEQSKAVKRITEYHSRITQLITELRNMNDLDYFIEVK